MKYGVGTAYLSLLGIVTSFFGSADIVLSVAGRNVMTDLLVVSGSMWSLWKGVILFSAGIFLLIGALSLDNVHGLGKAVVGSIMLWIVAGSNIFARITASIPGENTWLNSLEGFLGSYCPPYELELWLLPFSLAMIYFLVKKRE